MKKKKKQKTQGVQDTITSAKNVRDIHEDHCGCFREKYFWPEACACIPDHTISINIEMEAI